MITGANGFLSQYVIKALLQQTSYTILALGKGASRLVFPESDKLKYISADITDGVAINNFLCNEKPGVIVHIAAKAQPDFCEEHKAECWDANVTATRFLLDASKTFNPHFIFCSTDFVFNGEKGFYSETDEPDAVSYYGSSKIAAEKAVAESKLNTAIVRTCLCYGIPLQANGRNFLKWVLENLKSGNVIQVFNDQHRTPTFAEDFAEGILKVIETRATGIYHIAGDEEWTPFKMALAVADKFGLDKKLIEEIDETKMVHIAKRPAKTGLNIAKAKSDLAYQPHSFIAALEKIAKSIH